jgi:RsiW-degrading membrane proteinase PrsW (M82 family)
MMSLQTPEPPEVGSDAGLSGAAAPDAARPSRVRRLLRRLSWLWVLLAGVGAYLLLLRTLLVTKNPNFFPSLILLGSIVVPAAVLTFAATGGKRGIRVNAGIVTFTVIAGGILGTVAAGTLEYDTLRALDALPMIMVALIEEASKILVPAAVLLINRGLRWPAAVVLGIASGTGFATLETMGYGFTALLSGGLAALDETLLLRALLAPAGHVAWTGLSMGAIGRIRGSSHRSRATFIAIGVFVAVVILHAVWDASSSSVVRILVALLSFIALMLTLVAARRAEGSVAAQTIQSTRAEEQSTQAP